MDDPLRVHAEALADLDRRVHAWRSEQSTAGEVGAVDYARRVTEEIAGLEGRKRILQRHAPVDGIEGYAPNWVCSLCIFVQDVDHEVWPCDDWRDAAGQETPE